MAEPDDTIAALSPVIWWKLNEASGTTADNAGSGGATYDGTRSAGASFGGTALLPASADTSLDCDATGGNVTVAAGSIAGDTFSFLLFFELDATDAGAPILLSHAETGVSDEYIAVYVDGDGFVHVDASTPDGLLDFGIQFEPPGGFVGNGVHMLGVAFQPDEVRLVVDGDDALDGGFIDRTLFGSDQTYTTQPFTVGSLDDGTQPVDGRIAHVVVTDTTLTVAEMIDVWTAAGFDLPPWFVGEVDGAEEPPGPEPDAGEFYGAVDGGESPDGPDDVAVDSYGLVDGAETPDGVDTTAVLAPATIDGAEAPAGISAGQVVEVMSVDGATPVGGPAHVVTGSAPPAAYAPVATVSLYDRTGTTLVADLDGAFDVTWQDVVNDTGIGKFSLALSDPQAALVAEGQLVRCSIYGLPAVFCWRIDQHPRETIQQDEEVGQIITASGRGWSSIYETVKVYPAGGTGQQPPVDQRSFSFASPGFPAAGWSATSIVVGTFGNLALPWRGVIDGATVPAPFGWPELATVSKWIWATNPTTPVGSCYFRQSFTLASETTVTIIATADNLWTLYLDGVSILGDNANLSAWREHRRAQVTLAAGVHWLAAVVNNPSSSPAGFLCSVYVEDPDPEVDPTVLLVSDGSWASLAYPAVEPGYTPGAVMLVLIAEAQARGQLTDVTVDFTAVNDSAGVPWQTMPEMAVPVGASLLDVLGLLVSGGWCDWWVAPGMPRLSMWAFDGRGSTTSVEMAELVNISDLNHGQAQSIINRLLVKYPGGMFTVNDTASQTAHGVLEAFLTLDVADVVEATRLANRALVEAVAAQPAITLVLEPAGDDLPYVDWQPGDRVTAPSPAGDPTVYRALSITINVDDMGDVEIGVELNRRTISIEETRTALLRSLGSGVVGDGSGSKPVSKYLGYGGGSYVPVRFPTTTNDVVTSSTTSDQAGGDEIVFSYPGTVSQLAIAPPWAAPYSLKIYEVVMMATTAGATDVTIDANGSTFDLNGGDALTSTPTALLLAADDVLTVELTDIGDGDVVGLTVIFRYRPN